MSRLLPGELIPAAKVAHSNEGLLAFLVVIIWHVYNAHLSRTCSRSTRRSSPGASTAGACCASTRSSTRALLALAGAGEGMSTDLLDAAGLVVATTDATRR